MGIFPTAQLLYIVRGPKTPRGVAQRGGGGGRFVLAALLCTPIYVYGVCIEYACAVLLFRVAVSLSLRVFTWSGRAFSPLQVVASGGIVFSRILYGPS